MTDTDVAIALRNEYPYDFATIKHFVSGCNGDLRVARIAIESRITARVLLKFNAVDHFERKLAHESR